MNITQSLSDRFWRKVKTGTGCWVWKGAHLERGYGVIGAGASGQGNILAHRLSWELHNGPIPPGAHVLHKCDNPPCVRPDHLWLGSIRDNQLDKLQKGRAPRGERHPTHKLTEAQVREIKLQLKDKPTKRLSGNWRTLGRPPGTYAEMAERYDVSEATIRDIAKRKTWKHIEV